MIQSRIADIRRRFALSRIGNGDYLGTRLAGEPAPPVIYLPHDDESREIAPSFTAFLTAWERLGYLGPEIWMLEPFLNPAPGHLDADSEPVQALRRAALGFALPG